MQISYKLESLTKVAEYIVSFDSKEYQDYTAWCEENGLNPKDIDGDMQSTHVYAQALVGLGMEYEAE